MDTITGGNDNTYIYPPDPINGYDLTGQFSWKTFGTVLSIASLALGIAAAIATGPLAVPLLFGLSMGLSAASTGISCATRDRVGCVVGLVSLGLGATGGVVCKAGTSLLRNGGKIVDEAVKHTRPVAAVVRGTGKLVARAGTRLRSWGYITGAASSTLSTVSVLRAGAKGRRR
jgi:hypothetical protein